MKTTIVTLFCLMLMNFISEAYGCRCSNFTQKKSFCNADFVIRGIAQNNRILASGDIEYDVNVEDNFKMIVNKTIKLRSRSPNNSCGVHLDTGTEYLIAGAVVTGRTTGTFYYTDLCNWFQNWQGVDSHT
ncbi:metalloproteinase inhibitor 3-like [Mytilus californianus]|uniref:metalloproteinase inhibitor 3-like n=1 Tax=Mytilus californianus TaxID=6549 RepID=UPI002247485C|nr:metalloproteinase inhibitor 3-like [Mytilus californianus]